MSIGGRGKSLYTRHTVPTRLMRSGDYSGPMHLRMFTVSEGLVVDCFTMKPGQTSA